MSLKNVHDENVLFDLQGSTKPVSTLSENLTFYGPFQTDVNCTFQKIGRIIILSIMNFSGNSSIAASQFQATIPDPAYYGITTSLVYVSSYDSTGTTLGTYPGYVKVNSSKILIGTTGDWTINPTSSQGLPYSVCVAYLGS